MATDEELLSIEIKPWEESGHRQPPPPPPPFPGMEVGVSSSAASSAPPPPAGLQAPALLPGGMPPPPLLGPMGGLAPVPPGMPPLPGAGEDRRQSARKLGSLRERARTPTRQASKGISVHAVPEDQAVEAEGGGADASTGHAAESKGISVDASPEEDQPGAGGDDVVEAPTEAEDPLALLEKTLSADGAVRGKELTWVPGEAIGRGSFGEVFQALEQKTGRIIAVKQVYINRADEQECKFERALLNEIDMMKGLEHPHIVCYLGHDEIDSCLYLYLEYVAGGSLSKVLKEEFAKTMSEIQSTFMAWATNAEAQLRENHEQLQREKQAFQADKERVWQDFQAQKQSEYDRIQQDKKRAEMEANSTSRQIKQERDDHRAKLGEDRGSIDKDVLHGRRRFTLEREKFRAEYEAAELERQRISDHNVATETMVDINVGGVIFEAARQTCTQQTGSLLERLLTGRASAPRDRDGRIFLDRDSSLFRQVLNFLREPSQPPPAADAATSEALCAEAEYFGLRFFPFPLVYAVGGHDGKDHLNKCEVLDVEQQCWRPCMPMKTDRTYFGADVLHSRLHLFGGQNLEYKALCETECFDCLRGVWMPGAELNVPRRNCAAAQLDGRIYAIGGFDGSQILSHVEAYDPRMKNWMPLDPMTTPRSAAAAVGFGGKIWCVGGTNGTRLRTVESYDPRKNAWRAESADMIEVRSAGQSVNCLDRLYALGGTDQNQTVHQSMEAFNLETSSWVFAKGMQLPRMEFGACVLSDSIMVAGGQQGEVYDSVEFYRPELDDWSLGPPMLDKRYGHQLLAVNL